MALVKRGMYFLFIYFFPFNLLTHLYEIPERLIKSKYPAARVLLNMYAAGLAKGEIEVRGCVSVENVTLGERQQNICTCQSRNI